MQRSYGVCKRCGEREPDQSRYDSRSLCRRARGGNIDLERVRIRDVTRHYRRQRRARKRQKERVYREESLIKTYTLRTEDVGERYAVKRAHNFGDYTRERESRRRTQKGVFPFLFHYSSVAAIRSAARAQSFASVADIATSEQSMTPPYRSPPTTSGTIC